jgi:hypothetical protein
MQQLKGHLVYWEVADFDLAKNDLEEKLKKYGFNDYIPRNDFKTSYIRALKKVLRGNERFYRRLNDRADNVHFAVILPEDIAAEDLQYDVDFKKELMVKLSKKTGSVEYDHPQSLLVPMLNEAYKETKKYLDAGQFRTLILRIIRENCRGVSVRKRGGLYYVPKDRFSDLEKLREIFTLFSDYAQMFEFPIRDDEESKTALETAIHDDIFGDLEAVITELKEGVSGGKSLTDTVLKNRKETVGDLLDKVKFYEEDLRSKADQLKAKAQKLFGVLESHFDYQEKKSRPMSLGECLASL